MEGGLEGCARQKKIEGGKKGPASSGKLQFVKLVVGRSVGRSLPQHVTRSAPIKKEIRVDGGALPLLLQDVSENMRPHTYSFFLFSQSS